MTDFCFYIGKTVEKINYRYLYYHLKSIQDEIYSLCLSGSISTLNMANLSLLSIAFPSLDTQNKIVSILDQFNNLTSNLQDGIPAEIKLRKEQYQYYLKQLLCFDKQLKIN
ncbi:restriction endonuclease subunit S [bacterium]|nr:restriction endonuclease subunit S [bacterium]